MNSYDFKADLQISNEHEQRFADWLKSKGMKDVKIVPNDVAFHDYDILSKYDSYEIKVDRWFEETGNVLIETYSNKESNSLGWFMLTKAKWLIVFYNQYHFYGLSMKHLRDTYYNHPEHWRMIKINQQNRYTTICWLCHISKFEEIMYGDIRI
jgi:hypothetical protein